MGLVGGVGILVFQKGVTEAPQGCKPLLFVRAHRDTKQVALLVAEFLEASNIPADTSVALVAAAAKEHRVFRW